MIKEELRITVSGIIKNGDKILLIRRSTKDPQNPGKWDLPGGRLNFRESPIHAIIREIHEETSIKVTKITPYSFLNHIHKSNKKIIQTVQIIFQTNYKKSSKIKLRQSEHVDYIWATKNDLQNIDLVFKSKLCVSLKPVFN